MNDENVRMIDVGDKKPTAREAVAAGRITMSPRTREKILEGELQKGNVMAVAKTAGIMAAKRTPWILPLCHPLPVSNVEVNITPEDAGLYVEASVGYRGKTGVEMEALTACTVTLLTVYDMAKSEEKGMEVSEVKLLEKAGGRSGHWTRE